MAEDDKDPTTADEATEEATDKAAEATEEAADKAAEVAEDPPAADEA